MNLLRLHLIFKTLIYKKQFHFFYKNETVLFLSGKRGSNPRPPAWKASALSTELFPLVLKCAAKLERIIGICK